MKLLLVSDLHHDLAAMSAIVRRAPHFDAVVIAGDLCNGRQGLSRCTQVLTAIQQPTVLVAGNNETTDELRAACAGWPAAVVLHGEAAEVAGVRFFGLGGGIPITPFGDWSYDFTEAAAAELLRDCPDGGVIVSHSPPHGVLDQSSRGVSLGSVALRQTILQRKPRLVVCGHIHASGGRQERFGETLVVNAGPQGIALELEDPRF